MAAPQVSPKDDPQSRRPGAGRPRPTPPPSPEPPRPQPVAPGKVYWTAEEKHHVTRRAAELALEHPDWSPLKLLREAQVVLPEGRHRTGLQMDRLPWFQEQLAAEKAILKAKSRATRPPMFPATTVAATEETIGGFSTEAIGRVLRPDDVPAPEKRVIRDEESQLPKIEALFAKHSAQLTEVTESLREVAAAVHALVQAQAIPANPDPAVKHRVVVLGAHPDDHAPILKAVDDSIGVIFLDRGSHQTRLPSADYAIVTNDCSPFWASAAVKTYGIKRVVRPEHNNKDAIVDNLLDLATRP